MDGPGHEIEIVNFHDPAAGASWQIMNDTVMGGLSESTLKITGNGTALFTGRVSLENFGGFCSASFHGAQVYDLSTCHGIVIRVRADGKNYKLLVKTDSRSNGFSYQFSFATKQGSWMTVRAPFQEFTARFRGAPVPDAPPLDRSRVHSFGFLIGERQAGPFTLEIESIKAYGMAPA